MRCAHGFRGGYHEIQAPPCRYRLIDRQALAELLGIEHLSQLAATHAEWIEAALRAGTLRREAEWTESVAVGRRGFVERIGADLGDRARHRRVEPLGARFVLREAPPPYGTHLTAEMASLTPI